MFCNFDRLNSRAAMKRQRNELSEKFSTHKMQIFSAPYKNICKTIYECTCMHIIFFKNLKYMKAIGEQLFRNTARITQSQKAFYM